MKFQRKLSNGSWTDDDRIDYFLGRAVEFDKRLPETFRGKIGIQSNADAIVALKNGKELQYDSDWYAIIRDADALKPVKRVPVKMKKCDCGHTVPSAHAISASRGSACPDCYDRMSD